jgi:magnesium transporter
MRAPSLTSLVPHRYGFARRRARPGATPGTLTANPEAAPPVVHVIAFGADNMVEKDLDGADGLKECLECWPVTWVDVDGLGDEKTIGQIGSVLGLHPLALEDVLSGYQRSKVEQYDEYKFIVVRMVELEDHVVTEQLSLFLSPRFVATFQERPGPDCLEPVRERIRHAKGRIRSAGTDYLAYALIDTVIDHYFPLVEQYGDRLEALEAEVVSQPTRATPERILSARRDLMLFRRSVWPLREALNALLHDETDLIGKETRLYLRDCYDHTIQLIDMIETYREIGTGLMDVYLSSVSNRMNEIMKVLTVIATIFIPLTFICSVYGMNFDPHASPWNMPELGWRYGYPATLAAMFAIAVALLAYFRRKGWIGSVHPPSREPPSPPRSERA